MNNQEFHQCGTCESCGGNDEDAPCAYPSENKPGCLRDARMAQPETDIDQAQRFK